MEFRFLDREWSRTTAAAIATMRRRLWLPLFLHSVNIIVNNVKPYCRVEWVLCGGIFIGVLISKELNGCNIIHFIYDAKYWSISLAVVRFSSNISFSTPPLLPPPKKEKPYRICVYVYARIVSIVNWKIQGMRKTATRRRRVREKSKECGKRLESIQTNWRCTLHE